MFGFLKKKLKNVISSISSKIKKEAEKPVIEEKEFEKGVEEKRVEEKKEKRGIIQKFKELVKVKLSEEDFERVFKELELTLIENNVALQVIDIIKENLKKDIVNKPLKRKEVESKIKDTLRDSLDKLLLEPFDLVEKVKTKKPFTIVFFGINGSGKTTTIAKIAYLLQQNRLSSVMAASDTFRAASIEQLEKHGANLKVKVVRHRYGADPAAVAFDAIAYAKSRAIDVVLIDTAGRMHTQANLMREMEKICRVSKPDLKIFIGESIVGNDAVEQAKAFNDAIGIDAIILAKADVDEKGGAAISVSHVTGKPILYLGVGQRYNDLEKFNKYKVINSLGLE